MKKIRIIATDMTVDAHVCEHTKIASVKLCGRPYKLREDEYEIVGDKND